MAAVVSTSAAAPVRVETESTVLLHDTPEVKPTTEPGAKPTDALTPPESEEMNHEEARIEQEDSELSELDLDDEEDEEEIEPDHYWDDGRIPVFKPTMEQFRSFKRFVDRIDKYGMKSGIVKVIPPKEWRDSLPKLDEYIKRIKIKNPITQEFNGTQGVYTQQNVEKQRSYNLPEWKALTEETQHQPPAKRGERRRNQEKVIRGAAAARTRTSNRASSAVAPEAGNSPRTKRKPGRPKRNHQPVEEAEAEAEAEDSSDPNIGAPTPSSIDTPSDKPIKAEKTQKSRGRPAKSGGAGQAKSVTSRRLNNTAEAAEYIDEAVFENFQYNIDDLSEYTPERCAELESHYWRSLGFNQPMYAADMPGSLFDDTTTSWNVAKLENLLDVLGTKVPGVNTAYLYMGMWKATFAWHLEDVDLYSINYIHFGAPKQWYSISQEDARKFEKAMKSVWPVDAKNCDQFLRHKTYLISPDVLQKQYGVKVNKLVHYEGEFVITFPYGYHSGYNIGYNCAESVNFATESWLDFGKIARKCNCEADNVWVDVFEIERKLRGEPTPEYIEQTDDESDMDEDGHLPSPPASVKGRTPRKRKRGVKQEEPKKKRKIRIRIRAPTREPCVMCPNDNPWESLIPTDNGKRAHRSCALYTPETWIAKKNGIEVVCGVTTIDRARLDLKCNYCCSKRGACFQCSSKKCTRAFHATCALAAGVQVDAGMVPTFGEDGTEYFEEGYDFRCKYHRPKMPKNLNVESLENSKRVNNYAKELKKNDVVQAQLIGGEVFAGLIIENRPNELTAIVDVLPEGERIELDWKWICVLDPNDSLRPKPTANAIPMPEGMNKMTVSISNRQDGVPTQDEPFHENPSFKWHDFYNMDMPPPGYQTSKIQMPQKLEVNFLSPDQLYYYLPTNSTELKCFFSDNPSSNEVSAKANFIERVKPSKPVQRFKHCRPLLASVPPGSRPNQKQPIFRATGGNGRSEKPYVYKPRALAALNPIWKVDQQALANQRAFLYDSSAHSPRHSYQQLGVSPQLSDNSRGGDVPRNGAPLRSFPNDQYYSLKTLPAAYPGQHSVFRDAARRESQGPQTMQQPSSQLESYVPNYQSVQQQQAQTRQSPYQPVAPMAGTGQSIFAPVQPSPHLSNARSSMGSGQSSSLVNYQSPYTSPLTPATAQSTTSATSSGDVGARTDIAYLENLRKYPYLEKSFCRRPKSYISPYQIDGGFNPRFLDDHNEGSKSDPSTTSIPSTEQRSGGQWTPPSQIWDRAGFADHYQPTIAHLPPPVSSHNYTHSAHSPPQEFQRQQHSLPSTASRDGAQARLLRDQGYNFYPAPYHEAASAAFSAFPRNSHAHPTESVPPHGPAFYDSPKAPTPSPLSDSNTPGGPVNGSHTQRTPTKDGTRPPIGGYGYGSMMPHCGGREAWRFG